MAVRSPRNEFTVPEVWRRIVKCGERQGARARVTGGAGPDLR